MAVIPLVNVNNLEKLPRTNLTLNDVSADNKFHYVSRNMDFTKDLGLKGKYCYHPFNTITVDNHGDVFMCVCQAWLPISVGNILEFNSLEEIAHSPKAREIQASIIDGTFKYCDHNSCSLIKTGDLSNRIDHRPDTINWINFCIDNSCNLTCPSCRQEFMFVKEGPVYDHLMQISDHLARLINEHNHYIKFSLSSDGDPFASLIYRNLMSKLDLRGKTAEIEIITNGILLKDHWHKLENIYDNIIRVKMSFDAGNSQTYSITRRGGNWDKLIEGSKHVIKWKQKSYSDAAIAGNFVVQATNYRDMPEYVRLCLELGFDEIMFQKIVDWGTFNGKFAEHAVWDSAHPEHQAFLEILKDPIFDHKKVIMNNVAEYREIANSC